MEGVEPRLTPKSLQESPRQPSSSGVVKGHIDHTFYSRVRQALVDRSISGCFVSPLSTLPALAQRRVAWTLPIEHSASDVQIIQPLVGGVDGAGWSQRR